ncbi:MULTISPECIES: ATP-binding protein [unclassified Streptomyces]|uniref:ATP-binding protein n=1 Tax=Streptomyces sp. NPDC007872 TaxID=3364782 RepID=UPI0036C25369
MKTDPAQPWGVAIDYAGRAIVTEGGHTFAVRVYDNTFGSTLEPDSITGAYPSVYVSAHITETGARDAVLRGSGLVVVDARDGAPTVPDASAVERAVAAALADFGARREAYAALCAAWAPPAPEPEPTDPAPVP